MTPQEFREWLKSQQRPGHKPKPAPVLREPGDETDFAPMSDLADRIEQSMKSKRMQSYGQNLRERT